MGCCPPCRRTSAPGGPGRRPECRAAASPVACAAGPGTSRPAPARGRRWPGTRCPAGRRRRRPGIPGGRLLRRTRPAPRARGCRRPGRGAARPGRGAGRRTCTASRAARRSRSPPRRCAGARRNGPRRPRPGHQRGARARQCARRGSASPRRWRPACTRRLWSGPRAAQPDPRHQAQISGHADLPDRQATIAGQHRGDVRVVIERGGDDLIARFQQPADGAGQQEVERRGVLAERDTAGVAVQERAAGHPGLGVSSSVRMLERDDHPASSGPCRAWITGSTGKPAPIPPARQPPAAGHPSGLLSAGSSCQAGLLSRSHAISSTLGTTDIVGRRTDIRPAARRESRRQ